MHSVAEKTQFAGLSTPLRTLIVEDSEDDALQVLRLLKQGGYAVDHLRVASMGAMRAALEGEAWDMVICDFRLPGFDGCAALALLRQRDPDVPFIVVSGIIGEDMAVEMMKSGASDYVMKGNLARLLPAVRREVREAKVRREHRQTEEALRASEAEFHTLAESMPQIVWITRADGWNVYFNKQWMDYTGLTLEQSLGHGWSEPFHPDDQVAARDAWRHAIATGGVYSTESRLRRADGIYRWWLVRGVPLTDTNDNIVKWFGTCTDIHDLKLAGLQISLANGALRESERRFSDLLANVELVSVMVDRDSLITYCNDYMLQITGWQREEVLGRDWFELFVPPPHERRKDVYLAVLADTPQAWPSKNEILMRSGARRLIRWNNSVLRAPSGEVVGTASIGEDITAKSEADARIRRLNRVYGVLSGVNSLIVRGCARDELYREACKLAVEVGEFTVAWVGVIDPQTLDGKVVARFGGEETYLANIRFTTRTDSPDSERYSSRAMRQSRPIICNDIASDPSVTDLLREELLARGHKSAACFPLMVAGAPVAVLALFSKEPNVFDSDETQLLLQMSGDISLALDHLEQSERLHYVAFYDLLTGLANRRLFLERVNLYMNTALSGNHKLALCLFDIERFKNITDTFGRQVGDALLTRVARWLTNTCGGADLVARVGADLFAIVVPDVTHEEDVARLLETALAALTEHTFPTEGHELRIAGKVGVALFPDDGASADSLFANAEAALKKAKASGDRLLFYAQKMTQTVAGRLTLEFQLRLALERQEFRLHYQPKINLADGKLTGAEALIRWLHPGQGLVPPNRFIPILEETGLIFAAGRWALQTAIADYLRLRAAGLQAGRISVNVSALQLRNRGFVAEIQEVVGIGGHAAEGLELEITESKVMDDVVRNHTTLQAIRAMGIKIAIDDFGTGFSSLNYLARLPVDTLKIDRSFIVEMTRGEQGMTLVSSIINLAHSLKLNVVAEGVETEEQARVLRALACDEMQGWLFSKALPIDEFEALLRKAIAGP